MERKRRVVRKKRSSKLDLDGGNLLKEAYDRVKGFIKGRREEAPPAIRNLLTAHGNAIINRLRICRVPIDKTIDKVLNIISVGKWAQNKKKYSYDDLFHLYAYINLSDGYMFRIEKNHVVVVQKVKEYDLRGECMEVFSGDSEITLNMFIGKAQQQQGTNFWLYDPVKYNCQQFISSLLNASGLMTPELNEFINQCAECVLQSTPAYIARFVTDLVGRADILLHGNGVFGDDRPNIYKQKEFVQLLKKLEGKGYWEDGRAPAQFVNPF